MFRFVEKVCLYLKRHVKCKIQSWLSLMVEATDRHEYRDGSDDYMQVTRSQDCMIIGPYLSWYYVIINITAPDSVSSV